MPELGLYEPFKDYVEQQLKVRRAVLANPRNFKAKALRSNAISGDETKQPFHHYTFDSTNDFQTNKRMGPEQFYAYTTQKTCTIRMMSGVDILEDAKNKQNGVEPLLKEDEKGLTGNRLAQLYILEGGTINARPIKVPANQLENSRESNPNKIFTGTAIRFSDRGFGRAGIGGRNSAYGDRFIRANAGDGFGNVPMPGITSAKINTVSKEGALREATVEFSCHNRRQLEILELLYRRPGYNIMLEWGWNPYISNSGEVENNDFTSIREFFNPNATFDSINLAIRNAKEAAAGNYDAFFGFCKNFSYKAREDGGYDCSTEIVSHNSILESLQVGSKVRYEGGDTKIEDDFIYYLLSIEKNVKRGGDEYNYKVKHSDEYLDTQIEEQGKERRKKIIRTNAATGLTGLVGGTLMAGADYVLQKTNKSYAENITNKSKSPEGYESKVRVMNRVEQTYVDGLATIEELIKSINKGLVTDRVSDLYDPTSGAGFQAFLNGTILKQVIKYKKKRKKIVVLDHKFMSDGI